MAWISLSTIVNFFGENKKAIKKGENAYVSGHVHRISSDTELGVIKAGIQASMKQTVYNVEVCTQTIFPSVL